VEGIVWRDGVSGAASSTALEKLAAVAGGICLGASEQLSADGSVAVGKLELPTATLPRTSESGVAHEGLGPFGTAVPGITADWLVMDRWIRGGRCIAPNAVGECAAVLFAVFVLPVAVPGAVPIEILPAAVPGASNLGSAPRFTEFQAEAGCGNSFSAGDNRVDRSCFGEQRTTFVERATTEFRLGAELAGMVPRCDIAKA